MDFSLVGLRIQNYHFWNLLKSAACSPCALDAACMLGRHLLAIWDPNNFNPHSILSPLAGWRLLNRLSDAILFDFLKIKFQVRKLCVPRNLN